MEKSPTADPKTAKKQPKTKKKQPHPLKVVYITNPIKFKATASEFRALVQELTGQDADMSELSRFAVSDPVGGAAAVAAEEGSAHALEDGKLGQTGDSDNLVEKGSGQSAFGSDVDDELYGLDMVEDFRAGFDDSSIMWHEEDDANGDVFKGLY